MCIQLPVLQPTLSALRRPYVVCPRPQAGFPSPAGDYLESTLDLHDLLVEHPAATYYLRAAGDSMSDAHIYDGDILVVDRSRKPARGNIVIASVQGGTSLYVKKFGVIAGKPALVSCNLARTEDYPPIFLTEDVQVEIWGVVVGAVRKF